MTNEIEVLVHVLLMGIASILISCWLTGCSVTLEVPSKTVQEYFFTKKK